MSCCPPNSVGYLAADHEDEGTTETAGDVKYYHVGKGKTGLLIVPDIWGWNGGRTRALADDFAKRGLNVFVPALLDPHEGGTDGDGFAPDFDISKRMSEFADQVKEDAVWNTKKVMPMLMKVVGDMKRAGVERMGVVGFCYGGWVGLKLAAKSTVPELVCGVSPHPSVGIEDMIGGDSAKLASNSKCPWAFFPCGKSDDGGDGETYDAEGDIFKALEKKFPRKNVTKRYASQQHGFTVRGHIKENETNFGRGDDVKAAVQDCMLETARFLARFNIGRLKPEERPLRKPRWNKIGSIKPEERGISILAKVVKTTDAALDGAKDVQKAWDVQIGDSTGVVTLRLVDENLKNVCTDGASIRVQNARILMIKGFVRVIVDKWGVLKPMEAAHDFEVSSSKDISGTEYELA